MGTVKCSILYVLKSKCITLQFSVSKIWTNLKETNHVTGMEVPVDAVCVPATPVPIEGCTADETGGRSEDICVCDDSGEDPTR